LDDDPKRPYAATANVMAIIERCRTRNLPETIDDDVFRIVGIGPAVFGRVRQAMWFLNLTRPDNTPTDNLRAISKAPEQEYRQLLESMVREAYAEDFLAIDPSQDSQLQVFDRFRRYEPRSQTNRMVMLFLGLCREAGIPVKDAPRERKMQTPAAARSKQPKSTVIRPTTAKVGIVGHAPTVTVAPAAGLLFGVTEDDIAALEPGDFKAVWDALGKVALARANSRRQAREAPAADAASDDDQT
jgi:hypothetical protein